MSESAYIYVTNPATGKPDLAKPPPQPVAVPGDPLKFLSGISKGKPGIVDPNDSMARRRDWDHAYINGREGFHGVRWSPSWIRTDTNAADWQPAGADIYRIRRKGAAGADQQTLVLTTSPNSQVIPNGESVVIWEAANDTTVAAATTFNLIGYNLPLKSKLAVSACTPSEEFDTSGRRIIEINVGVNLPSIDYLPPFFNSENGVQKSTLQLRHWEFYADATNKIHRRPLPLFFKNSKIIAESGGAVILGGNYWSPSTYDWTRDYINFGATLTEELFRKECKSLAEEFGNTNPRLLAVELEHSPTAPWADVGTTPGYGTLLRDVWYPIARQEWGQERTLIVKGSGTVNAILTEFNWSPPKDERAHFALHVTDSGITGPGGAIDFSNIGQSDWLADALATKIRTLGFSGGGITSLRITPPQDTITKAKKLGRVLTSMSNKDLYTYYYAQINSDPATTHSVANIYNIDGFDIEALYPEMRHYASKAGLMTD